MKHLVRLSIIITIFSATILTGCSKGEDGSRTIPFLSGEIPYLPADTEEMPSWLYSLIEEDVKGTRVCQGTLDGQTVFNIHSTFMSNLYGITFNARHEQIDNDRLLSVKDWKCIYLGEFALLFNISPKSENVSSGG